MCLQPSLFFTDPHYTPIRWAVDDSCCATVYFPSCWDKRLFRGDPPRLKKKTNLKNTSRNYERIQSLLFQCFFWRKNPRSPKQWEFVPQRSRVCSTGRRLSRVRGLQPKAGVAVKWRIDAPVFFLDPNPLSPKMVLPFIYPVAISTRQQTCFI